ncbi:hypothetical protein [Phyllobacterium sp. K27]
MEDDIGAYKRLLKGWGPDIQLMERAYQLGTVTQVSGSRIGDWFKNRRTAKRGLPGGKRKFADPARMPVKNQPNPRKSPPTEVFCPLCSFIGDWHSRDVSPAPAALSDPSTAPDRRHEGR